MRQPIHASVAKLASCSSTSRARSAGANNTMSACSGVSAVAATACAAVAHRRRHSACSANNSRPASPAAPTQFPHATIKVRGGVRTGSATVSSAGAPIAVVATRVPAGSIAALMPLAVTRNCGSRVSMLRKAATARCSCAPCACVLNQESLDMPRIACAPRRAPSIASAGSTSSRQISGCTGISRPSANCSGNTRAPSPRCQVPVHGSRRRNAGPSSQRGTYSVSGNGSLFRYIPSVRPSGARNAAALYSPSASMS